MTDPTEAVRRWLQHFSWCGDGRSVNSEEDEKDLTFADLRALLAAHNAAVAENARLREALQPFAAMYREGTDHDEIACKRGYASDATCVFSGDFARAHYLLATPTDQRSV